MTDKEFSTWLDEYRHRRPDYVRFTHQLETLLQQLMDQHAIAFDHIEARTKDVTTLAEKLRRKGHGYRDLFADVHDLVGLRVVVYYKHDVAAVRDLLYEEFDVNAEHSGEKIAALGHNIFGYLSSHVVIRLNCRRTAVSPWAEFADFSAEVQIRTVAEHAWAAVQHAIDYKNDHETPLPLRRRLFRLSALLELADDEFAELFTQNELLRNEYAASVEGGELARTKIDLQSVKAYLTDARRSRWAQIVADADLLPALVSAYDEESSIARDRGDLVTALALTGQHTLADLDDLADAAGDWALEALRFLGREWRARPGGGPKVLQVSPEGAITLVVLLAGRADRELAGKIYGPTIAQAIESWNPQ